MRAWPVAAASQTASKGTLLKTIITGEGGGEWYLKSDGSGWHLTDMAGMAAAETTIDGDMAWKLFSKSLRRADIEGSYFIHGDKRLGSLVLDMISVMA